MNAVSLPLRQPSYSVFKRAPDATLSFLSFLYLVPFLLVPLPTVYLFIVYFFSHRMEVLDRYSGYAINLSTWEFEAGRLLSV